MNCLRHTVLMQVGTGMALVGMGAVSLALLVAGSRAARPFTSDPGVLAEVGRVLPPLALGIAGEPRFGLELHTWMGLTARPAVCCLSSAC